jgi:hypothetical protein
VFLYGSLELVVGWLVFQIVTPHDHSLCICVWVMSIRSTIKHVHDD